MLGLARISLDECEELYHRFGSDVFRQNPLVGTVKMGWTHSYYNTETWEMILRLDLHSKKLHCINASVAFLALNCSCMFIIGRRWGRRF